MRIIHELQNGRKVTTSWDGDQKLTQPGIPPVRAYVTADDVAEWYWCNEQQEWVWLNDFGPLIPPFDRMWIEWAYPPAHRIVVPDDHPGIGGMEAMGVFVNEGPRLGVMSDDERSKMADHSKIATVFEPDDRSMTIYPMVRLRGAGLMGIPVFWKVITDADGNFRDIVTLYPHSMRPHMAIVEHFHPHEVLLAISFMNVSNARRDDEPDSRATIKTLKKRGLVPIAMNRIRLPVARSSSHSDVKSATGGTMPLHLVRGHFKTYTADAPLFGKATGTYWWGWQSRGKAERGVRGHTYEVNADRESA